MTLFFNPFSRSQGGNAWFRVGLASSFPDITGEDEENIAHSRPCSSSDVTSPGCKVFYVPKEDSSRANQVALDDSGTPSEPGSLRDQVLVFRYKGKFHAINQASIETAPGPSQVSCASGFELTSYAGVPSFILSSLGRDAIRHRGLRGCVELRHYVPQTRLVL